MNIALLRRHLVYRLTHLGVPGAVGLALLAAAAGFGLAVLLPAHEDGQRIDTRIDEVTRKLLAEQAGARAPLTTSEQLSLFYQRFPKGTTVPDLLGKLNGIAAEQKLSLDIGNYSLVRNPSARLDQFHITLPIKGTYPQIRKFIAAALATAPALALESVSFKREKVGDDHVEARLEFMLFLEKGA